jgi:hypothetical protein
MVKESNDPENKKAITIPGNTACEIASPIIAIFRRIRKHPSNAQETAAKQPVNIIQKSLIDFFRFCKVSEHCEDPFQDNLINALICFPFQV